MMMPPRRDRLGHAWNLKIGLLPLGFRCRRSPNPRGSSPSFGCFCRPLRSLSIAFNARSARFFADRFP